MKVFAAGCLLGLAGSVHCVVMCGPLVAAGGAAGRSWRRRLVSFITYHAGRGMTYQIIAVAAALFGRAFALAGLGAALSVACGVLLLAAGLPDGLAMPGVVASWMRPLRRASGGVALLAQSRPLLARFLGGVVNGFLPCGLTYAAALTSTTIGGPLAAVVFMAGFGTGTLPALALVAASAARWPSWPAARLRWLPQAALAVVGMLLIVRGLGPMGVAAAPASAPSAYHLHQAGPNGR